MRVVSIILDGYVVVALVHLYSTADRVNRTTRLFHCGELLLQ